MTSPAIIERPQGSWTINKSGGRSHPVTLGDKAREIQPDGEIRNANPNAAAAWGTDKSGDNIRSKTVKDRVPDQPAMISATINNDIVVDAKPIQTGKNMARGKPCHAKSASNGASDGPNSPAAGKCPNAGKTAPYSPAKTGPIIAKSVIIGNNGKKRRAFMRGAFWRLWGDYCATP